VKRGNATHNLISNQGVTLESSDGKKASEIQYLKKMIEILGEN